MFKPRVPADLQLLQLREMLEGVCVDASDAIVQENDFGELGAVVQRVGEKVRHGGGHQDELSDLTGHVPG